MASDTGCTVPALFLILAQHTTYLANAKISLEATRTLRFNTSNGDLGIGCSPVVNSLPDVRVIGFPDDTWHARTDGCNQEWSLFGLTQRGELRMGKRLHAAWSTSAARDLATARSSLKSEVQAARALRRLHGKAETNKTFLASVQNLNHDSCIVRARHCTTQPQKSSADSTVWIGGSMR